MMKDKIEHTVGHGWLKLTEARKDYYDYSI
jgi:hypothetical protein